MLADDFYRLSHHDVTGKPRLHQRAIDLGLAAALLGELLHEQRIVFHEGTVVVADRTPPADSLAHTILDQLVMEPKQHTIRTWLAFLSQGAHQQVTQRLLRAGHVRTETSRRILRQTTIYVPVDMNVAAAPWALLSNRLRHRLPMEHQWLCLAGLAWATGLDSLVLELAPRDAHDYLQHAISILWPPMRELVAYTRAAVGDAVLAHRT